MYKKKLLFVCSKNKSRSLTAENIFEDNDYYDVKSAGTEAGARTRVTEGLLGWADMIFVMEKKHMEILKLKFGDKVDAKTMINLNIPDKYVFMDEKLVQILKAKLEQYLHN